MNRYKIMQLPADDIFMGLKNGKPLEFLVTLENTKKDKQLKCVLSGINFEAFSSRDFCSIHGHLYAKSYQEFTANISFKPFPDGSYGFITVGEPESIISTSNVGSVEN